MKIRRLLLILTILIGASWLSPLSAQPLSVMSWNIRYDNKMDGKNRWKKRKEDVADLILRYQPALIGIQEALYHQLQFLDKQLKRYAYIGVGRDDGALKGEFSPIFYDTTRFVLRQSKTFWLSITPEEVSKGWDAALPRICTYGLFEEKVSSQKIWVFNTHFDHKGETARTRSAELIMEKIRELNIDNFPVILMGDLNAVPESEAILTITQDLENSRAVASQGSRGPEGTFNNFDTGAILDKTIDYIFCRGLNIITAVHIDDKRTNDRYFSDHLPVLFESELGN